MLKKIAALLSLGGLEDDEKTERPLTPRPMSRPSNTKRLRISKGSAGSKTYRLQSRAGMLLNLEDVWHKDLFTDVTLISNKSIEIKAHRAILVSLVWFITHETNRPVGLYTCGESWSLLHATRRVWMTPINVSSNSSLSMGTSLPKWFLISILGRSS